MTREKAIVLIECSANELRETLKETTMPSSASEQLQMYIDAYEMAISAIRQQDVADKKVGKNEPLTNAQKIRSMSDEELAEFLFQVGYNHRWGLKEYTLEWLQQPAEEEGHA